MILRVAMVLGAVAGVAVAEEVATETAVLGASAITLHLQEFLRADEVATLRLVMTNEQALSLFVPGKAGFAALAVSPEDGLIRDGVPVPSAVALGDMPDAAMAAANAVAACDAARVGKAGCVVVLEIAPAP